MRNPDPVRFKGMTGKSLIKPDSQPAQSYPHQYLVCGDQGRYYFRPKVRVESQGLWIWGRGRATAKWAQLEKVAFDS